MIARPAKSVTCCAVRRVTPQGSECAADLVATEEPLHMQIVYWFKDTRRTHDLALTMRTPGHDRELLAGFLVAEGIVTRPEDLADVRPLGSGESDEVVAELTRGVDFESWRMERMTLVTSSCGVCGRRSRELLRNHESAAGAGESFRIDSQALEGLPLSLSERQTGFAQTGGLHAAALVNGAGQIELIFEDIGRHNALDKLIGHCLLQNRLPLKGHLLLLSSRGSFELIQKAFMAGAPAMATVGAPSSLTVETAHEHGITLIGFLRDNRFNIYSGEWRIELNEVKVS
jgi:FdhD protein